MIRKFFRNAGFLVFVEFIIKLKGLVFIPLLSRYFGAFNYGVWFQVSTLVATVSPIAILGTDSAAMRYLPGKSIEEQKRYYCAWFYFLLIAITAISCILLLFRVNIAVLFFGKREEYELFIPLAAAVLFVSLITNNLRSWYRIINNAKFYGIITILQAVFDIFALVIVFLAKKGVYELILYGLAFQLLIAIFVFWQIVSNYGWSSPDFSIITPLLKYGLPLIPASYAMWGLNSMDRLFLVKYSTMSEIGIYGLAYGLGYMVIQMIINPIWSMYGNTAAELYNQNKTEDLQNLFSKSINLILLLTLPFIVIIAISGKSLVMILATAEFISAGPLIAVITSAYLFHMLASYYDISLGLAHKQYLSTVSIMLACLINLIFNVILIPKYTIIGAAIATGLGFLSQLIFSYIFANRYVYIRTDFRFPVKVLLASVLLWEILYLIFSFMPKQGIIPVFFFVCGGFLVYTVLLFVSRVISIRRVLSAIDFILDRGQ